MAVTRSFRTLHPTHRGDWGKSRSSDIYPILSILTQFHSNLDFLWPAPCFAQKGGIHETECCSHVVVVFAGAVCLSP